MAAWWGLRRGRSPWELLRPGGPRPQLPPGSLTPRVAILGAGAGGIAMAVRLKQAGIHTVTLYEKAEGVGGTWRDNAYPGAGCDVPSHLYSFSFAVKHDWSRKYARQPEILAYLQGVVRRFGVDEHVRAGQAVTRAVWRAGTGEWQLTLGDGNVVIADVFVSAHGQLNAPVVPDLPGVDDFAGTAFHSAQWRHDHDLTGCRVGMVGSGASVIQIAPAIAPLADGLTIFQRSPTHIIGKPDRAFTEVEKTVLAAVPLADRAYRAWLFAKHDAKFIAFRGSYPWVRPLLNHMVRTTRTIDIDGLEATAIRPDYPVGCKRLLLSNDYYETLARPDVDLVTEKVLGIEPAGVRTADGVLHEVDTLIWGTGFDALNFLSSVAVTGVDGVDLNSTWSAAQGAEAHLGLMVPGFPNFFTLYGPNTNLGHNSILFMVEAQVDLTVRLLVDMVRRGARTVEVRPEAMHRWQQWMQQRMETTVWVAGCTSWYRNASGKITNNWPGFSTEFWARTRWPRRADYRLRGPRPTATDDRFGRVARVV